MTPDFAALKGKRMSELTPAQKEDAHELWLREQVGEHSSGWAGEHIHFLLKRLKAAREESEILAKALQEVNKVIFAAGAPIGSQNYFKIRGLVIDALVETERKIENGTE